jgi:hypothetical protein
LDGRKHNASSRHPGLFLRGRDQHVCDETVHVRFVGSRLHRLSHATNENALSLGDETTSCLLELLRGREQRHSRILIQRYHHDGSLGERMGVGALYRQTDHDLSSSLGAVAAAVTRDAVWLTILYPEVHQREAG